MTDDNLNGASLSVLECRALNDYYDFTKDTWDKDAHKKALKKIAAGATKELPEETRKRVERQANITRAALYKLEDGK